MLHNQNSFYVTLFSNGSLEYYPENTLSKFTVKLPYPIVLSNNENWHVGLYGASYTNIKKQSAEKIAIKIKFENDAINLVSVIYHTKQFYDDVNKPNFFEEFKEVEYKVLPEYTDYTKYMTIIFTDKVKVVLERNVEYTFKTLYNLVYSQIKKKDREDTTKSYLNLLKEYNPSNERFIVTNFESRVTNPNSHYIFFYSDIIKPVIVNGIESRVLYIKPMLKLDETEIVVPNIQYCAIGKFHINELSILLADENGNQINFEEGTNCTSIVLHFIKGI